MTQIQEIITILYFMIGIGLGLILLVLGTPKATALFTVISWPLTLTRGFFILLDLVGEESKRENSEIKIDQRKIDVRRVKHILANRCNFCGKIKCACGAEQ